MYEPTHNTEYPIKEPMFPHVSNMGREGYQAYQAEVDEIDSDSEQTSRERYDRKSAAQKRQLSRVNVDWGRWKYMEVRYATQVDQDSRRCEWCSSGEDTDVFESFTKGNVVIREQFSNQDFKTLHMQCAVDKIEAIKRDIRAGQEKLVEIIRIVSS